MINDSASGPARVLVLIPMLPGYERVRQAVAQAIEGAGLELVWLEELLEDWQWLDWLYASVRRCDLVVANPSRHNAFVMYELGVARADAPPTLVVLDDEDSQLSGSLDGSPFLPYSSTDTDGFSDRLRADLSLLARAARGRAGAAPDPAQYYREAVTLLSRFCRATSCNLEKVDEGAFAARLRHSLNHGTFLPSLVGTRLGEAALLAAVVRSSRMVDTMTAIRGWVEPHEPTRIV